MAEMFNPAHPGRVLREWLGEMQVSDAAARLHVSRVTLSRILNCKAGISAEMSLRLSEALGTSPTLWIDLQTQYDLWRAIRSADRRSSSSTGPRRGSVPVVCSWFPRSENPVLGHPAASSVRRSAARRSAR